MTDGDFSYGAASDGAGLTASVSIFADRASVRSEIAEDMSAAGFRIAQSGALKQLLDGAPTGLGDVVLLDCPVVDAKRVAALSRLDVRIARAGAQLVVTTSIDALDEVFACFDQSAPEILVDASRSERVVAIGRTLGAISGNKVRELSEADRLALLRLSEQVDTIAQRIDGISKGFGIGGVAAEGVDAPNTGDSSVFRGLESAKEEHCPVNLPEPAIVRRFIAARQSRAKFFDAGLFADPAWDMLLDLTAAHGEGASVSVTSLCIASGVPPTTALRWVRQMTESGIFARFEDPSDRRRAFISLSGESHNAMARYFASLETPMALAA